MKINRFKLRGCLAVFGVMVLNPVLLGQGPHLNPNQITGTIRFTNPPDSPVGRILGPPGNQGFSFTRVFASSVLPPRLDASVDSVPGSLLSTSYEITVEASDAGLAYRLQPYMSLDGGRKFYAFEAKVSDLVRTETDPPGPDVILDFDECAGLLEVRFVSPSGSSVSVNGGKVEAIVLPNLIQALTPSIPDGTKTNYLAVRGGGTYHVRVSYQVGTDLYGDLVSYETNLTRSVACGDTGRVDCVVYDRSTSSRISGLVDMIGEYELPFIRSEITPPERYTLMRAEFGPFGNRRWHRVPATLSGESSGAFELAHLLPSSATTPPTAYGVWGQMFFRWDRWFQSFRTPGVNVTVPDTGETNLGDLFVMTPGYLRGQIRLQGPACSPLLSYIHFPPDEDRDGIPDSVGYNTLVRSTGVDSFAAGAMHTAEGGAASTLFQGDFSAATGAFDGNYDMALAGLAGEGSIWKRPELYLHFKHSEGSSLPERYIDSRIRIVQNAPAPQEFEIVPGQSATNDLRFCFSEVRLRYRSTSGVFYSPNLRDYGTGSFSDGTTNYTVAVDDAYGTPWNRASATNRGLVVTCLPAGNYVFRPFVRAVSPSGAESETDLPPISYTVPCGQCIDIGERLQLRVNAPACSSQPTVTVSGSVGTSGGSQVISLYYTLNGGPPQTFCFDCGENPSFTTDITLTRTAECADNVLTVTAIDDTGETSSVTSRIRFDNTPPALTQCPSNIVAECQSPLGTAVHYPVVAVDNCDPAPRLVCTPPSGSLFAPGIKPVTCTATDSCGNARSCGFLVTVQDTTPPVVHCPTNLVVECSGPSGTTVTFPATATDNCETNLTASCDPPSGTHFPLGETAVTCKATDSSGNVGRCSFTVRVVPGRLTIERTITVRWPCGILQGTDDLIVPWTDIPGATSPYTVPASEARRFYRARD